MEASVERFLRDQGEVLKQFEVFFQDDVLEKLARESRFIERSTFKLTGWMFLELHLLMNASGKDFSLNQMCEELLERHGVELTKQSLDERFNTFAVKFIGQCFSYVLAQVLDFKQNDARHAHFKRVVLTDSTSFQLPAHLAAFYRSNGGSTTGSSIKIHQRYELLNGSVLELAMREGKENDAAFLQTVDYDKVQEELHLLDLGYFKLEHLQALDQAGVFFISRYKTGVKAFVKDESDQYKPLDWSLWLEQLQAGQASCLPEVYLGEQKLKVRLLAERLADEAVEKRLTQISRKEANQSSKSKYHYQNSDLKKLLVAYNIFITNTTQEQLSPAQIGLYYKLRWQIELLFKIWKSIIEIDKVGKMSIFRFECYLYSRLIAILLSTHLHSMFKAYLEEDFELSEWKVIKHLKKS